MLVVAGWLGNSGSAWAATGSCAGASPITVSTALTSQCRISNGDALTVDASGSIITTGSLAVNAGSDVTSASFNNAGTVEGHSYGFRTNDGIINTLDNSGTIKSTLPSAGMAIYNSGTIYTLSNSGTIESSYIGFYNLSRGTLTTLNNTGTIRGATYAILSTGTLDTLNNSGTLMGNVLARNITLNLSGNTARIVGNVTNTGGSINLLSGTDFSTEGRFSAATLAIANGADLRLGASAHGLTVNAVSNAGTLHVAEGRVADVRGNYTQSGALRIGASNNTDHGRVVVNGNAVLTPTATFVVDVNAVNTLANGETLAGVISATGTLTNNAPTNNVSGSALFDFVSVTNGNAVDLLLVAGGTPARGIVPSVIQDGLLNGVPAATVLDGYIRGGLTGTDWDAVVTALGRLPTNASVAAAVGQLMPALHGNAAEAGLRHSATTGPAIKQQQALSGLSGGDEPEGRRLWVKPLGNWVDQDAVNNASGYKMTTQGIVGGVQADLNSSSSLGLALAYIDSDVQGQGYAASHTTGIESVQLTGYGQQALGQSAWNLGWQAGYTRSRFESERALGFIDRLAHAKYNADVWHLGLGVNRAYVIQMAGESTGGATTVTPGVNLDWRQFKAKAYTETGADALNLSVQAQQAQETILKIGAQVQHGVNNQWQWLANAALGYDLQSADHAVTAQFSGGGAAFTTPGLPRARTVAEFGIGMRYQPAETMEITARYDIALRKGLQDQTASLRLAWLF